MTSFVNNLDRLNRKERYFLIGMALGNPMFKLSSAFRQKLSKKYGFTVPDTAFVAMDYHLNWIFVAAALAFDNPVKDNIFDNGGRIVDGTQEDVDLLVAFEDKSSMNHVIMLEAKGFTAFSNRQFKHKMERIKSIFDEKGDRWPEVKPYFGVISSREPIKLQADIYPSWLEVESKIPWFEMSLPDNRLILYGCDKQGKPNQERAFWTVK